MPKVTIKKNTMVNSKSDSTYRFLPTSGFRRDNSVRSSLRILGNRWKQSAKAPLIKDSGRSGELSIRLGKWYNDTEPTTPTHTTKFFQPKTEIKLDLPIDNNLYNQHISTFLINSNYKIFERSMSKNVGNDDSTGGQRIATIRKTSVWANSTSSKNLSDFIF